MNLPPKIKAEIEKKAEIQAEECGLTLTTSHAHALITGFEFGAEAMFDLLATGELVFDQEAVNQAADDFDEKTCAESSEGFTDALSFHAGARWQASQDQAFIKARDEKTRELENKVAELLEYKFMYEGLNK